MTDKGDVKYSFFHLKGCIYSSIPNLMSHEGEVTNHHSIYHYSCAVCAINHHVCKKCNRLSKRKYEFKLLTCNEPVYGGNAHKTQNCPKYKQIYCQQGGLTSSCYSGVTKKHHNDNNEVGSTDDCQIDVDSQINYLNHGQVTSDETSSFDYNFDTCDIHEQTYDEKESATGIIDSMDNENSPSTLIQKSMVINVIQTTDWGNKSQTIYFVHEFSEEHNGLNSIVKRATKNKHKDALMSDTDYHVLGANLF